MQSNTFGKRGEIIAANYLKRKGYKILERNYKNPIGEIDLIAKDKDYLVFVEVKTRISRGFGDPLEAINEQKQFKIRNVATLYLRQHKLMDLNCRFDAIAVLGDGDDGINHIVDAF
ncbi:MAG: YraN family protein [Clostridia bacterium]|nr:YraN family protein [Clostridia bacterium]